MRLICFVCIPLLFLGIKGVAQDGKTILLVPFKYTKPYENISMAKEENEKTTSQQWMVFSDRGRNKTYTAQDFTVQMKTMDFLEPFYVVGETDAAVHIYKDEDAGTNLSPSAVDYGWVAKDKLLLWRKPLYNENDIMRKGMILNTEAALQQPLEKGEGSIVKFYDDPELRIKNDKISNLYTIFYIYKLYPDASNPKSALLGIDFNVNKGTVENAIWGWVSFSKLSPWDHRVAILPTTDEAAIAERKSKGIRSSVFCDETQARLFRTGASYDASCELWSNDLYKTQNQYVGNFMRFPVLEDIAKIKARQGDMKIGFIGDIKGSEGDLVDPHDYALLQKKANELHLKSRNINIIFVIDGTTSMGVYYPKISEGIISAMGKLNSEETSNKFRFGAVIYRDYAEGNRITEIIQLTKDPEEIARQLRAVNAKDFQDKDEPEAVFYGIKTAIQAMNLPPEETNNMFLIGDAGNHIRKDDSQVPENEIVELLTKYNYNFYAFQVHNSGTTPYYSFTSQMKLILIKVNQNQYLNSLKMANPMQQQLVAPETDILPDRKKRLYCSEHPYIFGGVYYCDAKTSLPADTLKKKIVTSIKAINDSTNRLLDIVNCVINGGGSIANCLGLKSEGSQSFNPEAPFWKYISKISMPAKNLEILISERYQIYSKGFAPQKQASLKNPLWQYELFYTSDEIYELSRSFNALVNGRTGAERREKFQLAWKTLLKGHIGNINPEEFENMTIEEIEKQVFGLPGTSAFLKLRFRDIDDKAKLSDQELEIWIYKIESNKSKIERIMNLSKGFEEYSFLSNDQRYFWIPQTFLP